MVYECGDLLAESERFPDGPRRTVVDVDLDRIRQERLRQGTFDDNRRGASGDAPELPHRRVRARAADRRHRAAPQGRPVPVRARRRRAARPRLLRGLQHPGLRARAAAARHRPAQGRHRRQRRPRLHPRADRGRQGDGPARPPAQRHPRASRCRASPPATTTKSLRHPAGQVARRHLRGARHHGGRRADARRPRPPVRRRRGGLRRHVRERPGRAAHRLPVPARQPPRRHRARHRRPVRARARLVHLRRRRPDVALQRQRRRAEDADPAPDPLGRSTAASSTTDTNEVLREILDAGDHPRADPGREGDKPQSTEESVGPYALQDFTLYHVLRHGYRPSKIAFLAWHAWRDADGGGVAAGLPRRTRASLRPGRRSGTGSRSSCSGSSPASSSARRCPTAPRSAPAAPCRRAATGGCRRTPAPTAWLAEIERVPDEASPAGRPA